MYVHIQTFAKRTSIYTNAFCCDMLSTISKLAEAGMVNNAGIRKYELFTLNKRTSATLDPKILPPMPPTIVAAPRIKPASPTLE